MTPACTESVSFLKLERHALGELSAQESTHLHAHLGACELCKARSARIAADAVQLRPLPAAVPPAPRRTVRNVSSWRAAAWPALAAAAALLLLLLPREPSSVPELPGVRKAIKGGSLSLGLVRERDGSIALDPGVYRDGDHFKVLLTCPARLRVHWDVVVWQDGAALFPLTPGEPLDCGNQQPLSGAFELTGRRPTTICASIDVAHAIDRAALQSRGSAVLPNDTVCLTLSPAAGGDLR